MVNGWLSSVSATWVWPSERDTTIPGTLYCVYGYSCRSCSLSRCIPLSTSWIVRLQANGIGAKHHSCVQRASINKMRFWRLAHYVINYQTHRIIKHTDDHLRNAGAVYLEPSLARRSGPSASVFQNLDGPVQMSSELSCSWIAHVSRHADLVTNGRIRHEANGNKLSWLTARKVGDATVVFMQNPVQGMK